MASFRPSNISICRAKNKTSQNATAVGSINSINSISNVVITHLQKQDLSKRTEGMTKGLKWGQHFKSSVHLKVKYRTAEVAVTVAGSVADKWQQRLPCRTQLENIII